MGLDRESMARFEAIYAEHSADVFAVCLRFAAGDRAWAMDRTQDVFMRLADKMSTLSDRENLGGWLYRVGVNTCLMHLRRQGRWRRIAATLGMGTARRNDAPDVQVRIKRDATALEEALARLPAKQRAVLTLIYLEGKSQAAVCELLGLSSTHVSRLKAKAVAKLKKREWEFDDR